MSILYQNKRNGLEIVLFDDEYLSFGNLYCEICREQIDTDTCYCLNCREFVEGESICETCSGKGTIWTLDNSLINPTTISPPYKEIECEDCGGKGRV